MHERQSPVRNKEPEALALAVIQGDLVAPWENSFSLAVAREPSGVILAVNRSFARKFGRAAATWLGLDFSTLLHPDDLDTWRQAVSQLTEAPHCVEYEVRCLTESGWRWIAWEEIAHFNEQGEIANYRAIGRDISQRKEAAAHAFLLARAVEQSPVGILITDLLGNSHYVNPKFTESTGYSLEALLKKQPSILRDAHPSEEAYQQFLGNLKEGKEWHGETVIQKSNGSTLCENLHITPVRNGDQEITHLLCLREDITEQKRLEAQLRQAQKMDSLGTLAGGIAHDFNNMLAIINGYAEVCLTKPGIQADEVLRRYLREIHGATQRAVGLVQRILTFSRKTEVKAGPINFNKLLRELGKLLEETFPRTVSIVLELDDTLPLLIADQNQMQQIIMNLCVNARDSMPKGGRILIETKLVDGGKLESLQGDPTKNYLCLQISDTGCGMPPEVMQRIFEPFYTTKHEHGGTGLGLAVVYGIILNHKGLLDVKSIPGQGSSFFVYFPLCAEVKQAVEQTPNRAIAEFPIGTENILVVEDEVSLRNLLCNVLGPCGYTVYTANDGRDALDQIRNPAIAIDAVILDLNMPEIHGLEVFRELVSVRPGVRALVVSGNITPEMQAELIQLGQKHFIHKPYRLDEICARLRSLLDT